MSVRIVIDSTTDVMPQDKKLFTVVPLTVSFGEEEYIDGVTIDRETFYAKLVQSDVLPTTSQPTPDAFTKVFKQAVQAGNQTVVITLSAKLSGTYQSACIAAADFPGQVYVVDSHSVAIGTGVLALTAAKMAALGASAESIVQHLLQERYNVRVIAVLDTLEYLCRGGRLSKTAAFAGEILALKPLVCIKDGAVTVLGKARGARRACSLMLKEIDTWGGIDYTRPVLLGYTGQNDDRLQKALNDTAAYWQDHLHELHSTSISSVIGTHAGPGAVAAAFFCNAHSD